MFRYIFSVPFWASTLIWCFIIIQCPIMCKFPIFSFPFLCASSLLLIHFIIFLMISLLASSLSLCLIISFACHYVQVPYLFTFHYIFSVPFGQVPYSLRFIIFSVPLFLCKFPIFLHSIISLVSHSGQVPYSFTFHYFFSVPLCASSLSFYISLYIQCPIMCKYPIILCFIISSVSHYVQVLHLFTFHYIFSVPFWASTLQLYVSLFLHPFCIISSVSHYVQVPYFCYISLYLYVSHYVQASSLLCASLRFIISSQCPIMCKFPIFLHFIISLVSHFGQVPYLFTFHYIFSVPLWASSLSFYISLYLQCPIMCSSLSFYLSLYLQFPIMCKFPNFLCFVISSHSGQVPCSFTFHYIFSVPLCASSLSFYLSLFPLCTIMCKFSFLPFIICSVSHYVQVLHLFTFHYIFSVPLWASSLSIYISLYLQCPIMCKFPTFVTFHYIFNGLITSKYPIITFNYIFRMSLCASSLSIYISLYLQCPILGKFPIYLHSIRSSVSHFGQVPYLFTFHYIFSVPFWASSLSIYIPLDLQCPIICMFPIFLPFIISLVSHSGQVPHSFTFHYFFSVPLCACSLSFYISLYIQCPIVCEYPIILCFIICSVSHYVQVLHLFTIHYIFSVPFWASTLQLYVSLFLQCPIMCMFPIFLHFIIYLVSHYVQVPYHFMFHYIFSVPLCASTLLLLHFIIFLMVSLLASTLSLRLIISFACHYVQVPYLFTFHYIFSVPFWASSLSIYHFIISSVSHYVQVHYLFTFHYIFSVPLCASTLSFYVSLYLQCPIWASSPFFSISSYLYHFGQVPYLFTFHQIFSVPFWASSLSIYISLYLQCPISGKFPIYLHSIGSSVSHYVHVPYLFTFHYIFSFPLCASSLTSYVSLYLQCPILGKYPIVLCFIISSVSHYVQVLHIFTFHSIFSVPFCASSLTSYVSLYLQCPILASTQ